MHVAFSLFLFLIYIFLSTQTTDFDVHRHRSRIFRQHRDSSPHGVNLLTLSATTSTEDDYSSVFFQNEPLPLDSSVVDDLTTLASAVYIISLIIISFIILAWITHYSAPCSSMITSLLSTLTGLPEPIIRSVAFCGLCCVWCETTWLFRRIHHFNRWISNKIRQFLSGTCKVFYDTICPCCQPPDTPSNRSIIGSLPASIIAMINVSDTPHLSPPKPIVTVLEPTSKSPKSVTVHIDLDAQSKTQSLVDNDDDLASNLTLMKNKINTPQTTTRKTRRKQPRKRTQLKQRSAIDQSSLIDEQIDDSTDDEDEYEDDENTEIY